MFNLQQKKRPMTPTLNSLRNQINHIDDKIVDLLNDRIKISILIGKIKKEIKTGIYSPAREKEVLARVKTISKGPMPFEALDSIYREIMSSSLAIEDIRQIAYLGREGTFSYMAAKKVFGNQVKYSSCASISEVFQKVEAGDCHYGVVPIENSVEGAITYTLDLLADSELKICRQILLPISISLLSNVPLSKIKKIYSNFQVFGQCRQWLQNNFPAAAQISMESTTEAAYRATKEKNSAAIASTEAAKVYKLNIVKENIQDVAHNTTRFLVISKQDVPPTGRDRTSILFSIKDKVGALHAMLTPFYKHKINLTKIESRPSKKRAWDYFFFVDFEGHRDDKNVKKALAQLEVMCKYLKILGSYPVIE